MLNLEEKLAIIRSFPELERRDVSLGRINFHYEGSVHDKKTVVYRLHPNGNGFVYAGLLSGYETDDKGFVNIRDFTGEELRLVIEKSIRSLSVPVPEPSVSAGRSNPAATGEGRWIGAGAQTLELKLEDDLWYLYAGLNLEMVFETYEEAAIYLQEEGFTRQPS